MKAYKCKNTSERLSVLTILDKMGMKFGVSGTKILRDEVEYSSDSMYLESNNVDMLVLREDNIRTGREVTTNLEEFLNQFRNKAYKCKSLEEQMGIIDILLSNGVYVYGGVYGLDAAFPFLWLKDGVIDQYYYTWKGETVDTPREFLKQWGIEYPQSGIVHEVDKDHVEESGIMWANLAANTDKMGPVLVTYEFEEIKEQQFVKPPKPTIKWRE